MVTRARLARIRRAYSELYKLSLPPAYQRAQASREHNEKRAAKASRRLLTQVRRKLPLKAMIAQAEKLWDAQVTKHYPGGQDHDQSTHGHTSDAPDRFTQREGGPAYHGTSVAVADSILAHGLQTVIVGRTPELWVSKEREQAVSYGMQRRSQEGDKFAVVKISIPKSAAKDFHVSDWMGNRHASAMFSNKDVPSEWISGYDVYENSGGWAEVVRSVDNPRFQKEDTVTVYVVVLGDEVNKHYPGGQDHDQSTHGHREGSGEFVMTENHLAGMAALGQREPKMPERALMYDRNGELVLDRIGREPNSIEALGGTLGVVEFTGPELEAIRGGMMMHSHPYDIAQSPSDIIIAAQFGLKSVVAIHGDHGWVVQPEAEPIQFKGWDGVMHTTSPWHAPEAAQQDPDRAQQHLSDQLTNAWSQAHNAMVTYVQLDLKTDWDHFQAGLSAPWVEQAANNYFNRVFINSLDALPNIKAERIEVDTSVGMPMPTAEAILGKSDEVISYNIPSVRTPPEEVRRDTERLLGAFRVAKFDPAQARDDMGRWTDGGPDKIVDLPLKQYTAMMSLAEKLRGDTTPQTYTIDKKGVVSTGVWSVEEARKTGSLEHVVVYNRPDGSAPTLDDIPQGMGASFTPAVVVVGPEDIHVLDPAGVGWRTLRDEFTYRTYSRTQKFDPDQARDELGRWTDGSGSPLPDNEQRARDYDEAMRQTGDLSYARATAGQMTREREYRVFQAEVKDEPPIAYSAWHSDAEKALRDLGYRVTKEPPATVDETYWIDGSTAYYYNTRDGNYYWQPDASESDADTHGQIASDAGYGDPSPEAIMEMMSDGWVRVRDVWDGVSGRLEEVTLSASSRRGIQAVADNLKEDTNIGRVFWDVYKPYAAERDDVTGSIVASGHSDLRMLQTPRTDTPPRGPSFAERLGPYAQAHASGELINDPEAPPPRFQGFVQKAGPRVDTAQFTVLENLTEWITLHTDLDPDYDDLMDALAEVAKASGTAALAQAGLGVGFRWPNAPQVFKWMYPDLVESVAGYLDNAVGSFAQDVARAVVNASNPADPATMDDLSKRIEEIIGKRSEMIARTESARVYGEVAQDFYERNGIGSRLWLTAAESPSAADTPVCPTCTENGDLGWVPTDESFEDVSGDPIDGPPAHPWCRCDTAANVRNWLPPKEPFLGETFDEDLAAAFPRTNKGEGMMTTADLAVTTVYQRRRMRRLPIGAITKYSEDQARDDQGRWTDGSSETKMENWFIEADQNIVASNMEPGSDSFASYQEKIALGVAERGLAARPLSAETAVALSRQVAEQNQWLIDHPDATVDGQRGAQESVENAVGRVALEIRGDWQTSAGDNYAYSIKNQEIAREEFGLDAGKIHGSRPIDEETTQRIDELLANSVDVDVAHSVMRGIYETTQDELRDRGIETLTVYRGMSVLERPAWAQGDNVIVPAADQNPLSSWSLSRAVAENFGDDAGGNRGHVVLSADVPRSRIFSVPMTGVGSWNEKEVIVFGGDLVANIVKWPGGNGDEEDNYDDDPSGPTSEDDI